MARYPADRELQPDGRLLATKRHKIFFLILMCFFCASLWLTNLRTFFRFPIRCSLVISVEINLEGACQRALRMKLGRVTNPLAPEANVHIRLRPTNPVDPFSC